MNLEALVSTLGSRDDRRVADQGIVDTRVWDQVGLELVQVDVESTVEAQGRGNGRHDLSNQAVEMLVARAGDIQVSSADIVDGFVINQEGTIGVLNGAVGREHGIVRLNNRGGDTRSRVDSELELALLSIVGREALEKESAETRAGATAEGVEDQEALQRVAVVCEPPLASRFIWFHDTHHSCQAAVVRTGNTSNSVNDIVHHFLANGVVSASIVVGSILLAADQQFRVEELAISTSADLVDGGRVKIDKDGSGNIFPAAGLGEERLERASITNFLGIGIRATVLPEAMLEEVPSMTISRNKTE